MDVQDRLNQLEATVRGAKTMPMSASCLVNRAEMLGILARFRAELPVNLDHADALLSEREAVLAAAREEAEGILEVARGEREQLIEQTDVLVAARGRAARVTAEARAESTRLLADADDYVDEKLAEFEVLLGQLASQVNNGRLRLTFRREADLARFQESTQGPGEKKDGRPDVLTEHSTMADPEVVDHQGAAAADVTLTLVDPAFG
jgi:cell division septum initiation protein DivIVA